MNLTQAKHTPGPWKHATPGCHAVVVGDKILASADADSPEEYDQGAIDFKLMAAAPELLDANIQLVEQVKQLLDQIEKVQRGEWKPNSICTSAARAVAADARETIAKATGGAA